MSSSDTCAWSVRTMVVNTALLRVNDVIFERVHYDIKTKYNELRSVDDLRRWIHNLPEYHRKFGGEIESFILRVLEGVKRFCRSSVAIATEF